MLGYVSGWLVGWLLLQDRVLRQTDRVWLPCLCWGTKPHATFVCAWLVFVIVMNARVQTPGLTTTFVGYL